MTDHRATGRDAGGPAPSGAPLSREVLIAVHERMLRASVRFWQAGRDLSEAEHRARVVGRLEAGDLAGAEAALELMEQAEL